MGRRPVAPNPPAGSSSSRSDGCYALAVARNASDTRNPCCQPTFPTVSPRRWAGSRLPGARHGPASRSPTRSSPSASPAGSARPTRLDGLHDADLYRVALASSDPRRSARSSAARPRIDVALRRLRLPGGTADEVKQALRFELLVGDGAPKIADYAGRGELAAWLRVTATRKALKLVRRGAREQTLDDILLDHWPDATPGPERRHLRSTYTAELKRAIGDAFATLDVRQRNLLRQHILDELTIDDLARLYRVHRDLRALARRRADLGRGTR